MEKWSATNSGTFNPTSPSTNGTNSTSSSSLKTPNSSRQLRTTNSSILSKGDSSEISRSQTNLPKFEENGNIEDPLATFNLTPEQRKIFDEFNQTSEAQSALPDDPFRLEKNKLRFIKGYEWKVDVAKDIYSKAIKWRTEHTPWRTKKEDIQEDLDRGVVQLLGKNKKGEPAFLVRVGKYDKNGWNMDDLARLTFYLCEEALRILEPPLMTTVFVIDLRGFQMGQYSGEMKEKLISPMALVYPELLGKGFTIYTPFLFEGLWKLIKPFLHPITVAKISVDGKNYHKHLMEAFDPEILPDEYRNEEMRQLIVERSHMEEQVVSNPVLDDSSDDGMNPTAETQLEDEDGEEAPDQNETILSSEGIMRNSMNSYVVKYFVLNPGRVIIYNQRGKKKGSMEIDLVGCIVEWSESKKSLILKKENQDQIYEEYSQDGGRLYLPTIQAARMLCKFKITDKANTLNQWFESINKQIQFSNSQAVPVKSNLLKILDDHALQKMNESVQKNLKPILEEQHQVEQTIKKLETSFLQLQKKIDTIEQNNKSQLRQIILIVVFALLLAKYLFNEQVSQK